MERREKENQRLPIFDLQVSIPLKKATLPGRLTVPVCARGLVIFAHGSGSSRFSPRNWFVAEILHGEGISTLLTDLLTQEEEQIDLRTRQLRFDILMLAERLVEIADWAKNDGRTGHLKVGYFGSSTGGGAALIAAAERAGDIAAVVSRGGRPDLAGAYLPRVVAPTLLIVGENDFQVLALNQEALAQLNERSRLTVIPGATHLFEETGTLDKAAGEAMDWFKNYLG